MAMAVAVTVALELAVPAVTVTAEMVEMVEMVEMATAVRERGLGESPPSAGEIYLNRTILLRISMVSLGQIYVVTRADRNTAINKSPKKISFFGVAQEATRQSAHNLSKADKLNYCQSVDYFCLLAICP